MDDEAAALGVEEESTFEDEPDEPELVDSTALMASAEQSFGKVATVTAGGVVSTFSTAEQRRERQQRTEAGSFVEQCENEQAAASRDVETARFRVDKAEERLQVREADVQQAFLAMKREEELAETMPNKQSVRVATDVYNTVMYELQKAHEVYQREKQALASAQTALDIAVLQVLKNKELTQHVRELVQVEQEEMRRVAEYRVVQEVDVARRAERSARKQAAQIAEARADRVELTHTALLAAEDGKRRNASRVAEARAGVASKLAELQEYKKLARKERQSSLLSLKQNTEVAQSKLRAANERSVRKRAAEEKAVEEEKKAILAAGGNPYEVLRRRREEERVEKEKLKLEKKQRDAETALASLMVDEEDRFEKQMRKEAKDRAVENKYQREMGRAAKEDRVNVFMRERTVGGKDIIDPSGRTGTLHGSKFTVLKTPAFGLGVGETAPDGTRPEVLKKVLSRHGPNATFDPAFVPPEPLPPSRTGEAGPAEGPSAVDAHGQLVDEFAQPEFQGLWQEHGDAPDGSAFAPSGGGASKGAIKTTALSKLEKDMMAKGLVKQRGNIVQPQVVCGREFKGASFAATPAKIEFADFELKKEYHVKLRLTNVSLSFSSFKLLELDNEIRNFFDIKYTPPGILSAGLTCDLHITFTPQIPQDIMSSIPLLSSTGPINVPLTCTSPKCDVIVKTTVLDYQQVVLCETSTLQIEIANSGKLPTAYKLEMVDCPEGMLTFAETGMVPGFKSSHQTPDGKVITPSVTFIAVTINPNREQSPPGFFGGQLLLSFEAGGQPKPTIPVVATVAEVPIFLERVLIDMETLLYEHVYRDSLMVKNRGKFTMRCEPLVPAELKGFLEFLPAIGFVQAGEPFVFQVKFRPTEEVWRRLEQTSWGGADEHTTGSIAVPFTVDVPDQTEAVKFTLKARLTKGTVSFCMAQGGRQLYLEDPKEHGIEFGACSVSESKSVALTVTNDSALEQKVGFVQLKRELTVGPSDGFFSLLPYETLPFHVAFVPSSAVGFSSSVICKSLFNRQYVIPVSGKAFSAPLQLVPNLIKLQACAEGGILNDSLLLKNTSREERAFEFFCPPGCGIELTPASGKIAPGAGIRLALTFNAGKQVAPAPAEEAAAAVASGAVEPAAAEADATESGAAEAEAEATDAPAAEVVAEVAEVAQQDAQSERPWGQYKDWQVQCCSKPVESEATGFSGSPEDLLRLHVHTTVVRPILVDEVGAVVRTLDFGLVTVGKEGEIQRIHLSNTSKVDIAVNLSVLDPLGPFLLLSGTCGQRPLAAQGKETIVVCFDPNKEGAFEQELRITSEANPYTLILKGTGVRPRLTVEPAVKTLHVGDALVGQKVARPITLTNTADFPLDFFVTIEGVSRPNVNGEDPFYAVPPLGRIEGGESEDVQLMFNPDHLSTGFGARVVIESKGQLVEEQHVADVTACGWESALFIVGGDSAAASAAKDPLVHALQAQDEEIAAQKSFQLTLDYALKEPVEESEEPAAEAVGEAAEPEPKPVTAWGCIDVGNSMLEKGGGDIAIDALPAEAAQQGFGLHPGDTKGAKLSPEAGKREQLWFSFSENPDVTLSAAEQSLSELGIGRWVEMVATGSFKGGTPAPSGDGKFEVRVRAYVPAA